MKTSKARDILIAVSKKHNGEWDKIYHDISNGTFDDECEPSTDKCITILDKEYPERLRNDCYRPPFVLYYEGDINLLKGYVAKIAIASPKSQNIRLENMFDKVYSNDYIYIVDESALSKYVIKTLNMKVIYIVSDMENADKKLVQKVVENGGLVISENSLDLLAHYRIMASLCDKALVVACSQRSGGNLLVSFTLQQGKDVLVIPLSPLDNVDYANNTFIAEGAIPVWDKETFEQGSRL